jgi:hypothetical protein
MNLQQFRNDHTLLTDPKVIKAFCEQNIGPVDFNGNYPQQLHTYGGCYWIGKAPDGTFFVDFANDHYEGNLQRCETYLYFCIADSDEIEWDVETIEFLPIHSITDVETFFTWCESDQKLIFHPDTAFEDYHHALTGEPVYTEQQAHILNQKLEDCFQICRISDIDLYEIAFDVHNRLKNENNEDISDSFA